MWNPSLRSGVAAGSIALFAVAFGPHAFGLEGQNAPQAVSANTDVAMIRMQLDRILEALEFQGNGGLQLHVEANVASCASGAAQCASPIEPSSINQIPIELRFFVMRDKVAVPNLNVADLQMTVAFSPAGGPSVEACAPGQTGCGTADFFINRENGGYHLWVHPSADNWAAGDYVLLFRVTDQNGHSTAKFVNVAIPPGPGDPRVPEVILPPGSAVVKTGLSVNTDK